MNAGTWALLKLDHVWYLRAVNKLSKKQLQKPSHMVLCFDASLAIARRVVTENRHFLFIDVPSRWRILTKVENCMLCFLCWICQHGLKKCKWNMPWNLQRVKPTKLSGSWFRWILGWKKHEKTVQKKPTPSTMEVEKSRPGWKATTLGDISSFTEAWLLLGKDILCSLIRRSDVSHHRMKSSPMSRIYVTESLRHAAQRTPRLCRISATLGSQLEVHIDSQARLLAQQATKNTEVSAIRSKKFVKFLCDCERVYGPQLFFINPTKGERTFPLIDCSNGKGALGSCLFGFWCFGAGPNPENQLWRQVLKIWLQVKSHEIYDRIRTYPTPSVEWKAPILQQYAELTFVYFCHVRKTVKSPLFLATSLQQSLILL